MGKTLKDTFRDGTKYKYFLLTVLITGLSYGLYKGVLDNYLSEIANISESGRGVTEFFRELPGVLLVFILAAFCMLSAEMVFKVGAMIMLAGMAMHAFLPPSRILLTLAICVYSLGEHFQLGMKSTLSLQYANPGKGGAAQGVQNSLNQVGTLAGYLIIVLAFTLIPHATEGTYRIFFTLATALVGISVITALKVTGKSSADRKRFYFHKKFSKYYMLEMFYGARKQVFLTFGPYALIRFYGANTATISLLLAISAAACFLLAPAIGRLIDKIGYKTVMVVDTLILVVVCLLYGYAHKLFPMRIAFIVCCVNYILDAVISMASMATNVYVQDIADSPEEIKATLSTGISINHIITIFIALFGGIIWEKLGMGTLFIISAILGICNSLYAASIKVPKK